MDTDIGQADTFEELGPATVYKMSVVLRMMLFQRLNTGASLRDAVLHFVETAPDELKSDKRLREGSLSAKNGSYSDARHLRTTGRHQSECHLASGLRRMV